MTSPQAPSARPGLKRYYYRDQIQQFLLRSPQEILGQLTEASQFAVEPTQRNAWQEEIAVLQDELAGFDGTLYFEFSIPRMGTRIDVLAIIGSALFIIEFKVNATTFDAYAIDQVWDYALDLKNFHEPSHSLVVAPILVATGAEIVSAEVAFTLHDDQVLKPIRASSRDLRRAISQVLRLKPGPAIEPDNWEGGRYKPTPTIVEAARALYGGHTVDEIWSNAAEEQNIGRTSETISRIIRQSRTEQHKSICLVTGVPGAGKTLVGLSMANKHMDSEQELYSVFLSGNDPLVAVLREALARDGVERAKERGHPQRKQDAMREVKALIQNIRHFRDEGLRDLDRAPAEHVALFDEAQRAWTLRQTANFMQRRRQIGGFDKSEPEFLISCMDRHNDWAVIVCLIGGGQEINTGEAGISEWIDALNRSFPHWHVYISPRLNDSEYAAGAALRALDGRPNVTLEEDLHLAVSMRSFRAEHVSLLVRQVLDLEVVQARSTLATIGTRYPIVITRDLGEAKSWLRQMARANERYGIVVSSQAERLRPHAIFVKSPMDPVHWFLDGKDDVRSSYFLEDVATEFAVQGLELDWACVTWDADFRFTHDGWEHCSFVGDHWNRIRTTERQAYLKNAYRVLMTRARQGMVIVVPPGDEKDPTRKRQFYDPTYEYLREIGFGTI
jgi:hypothetical protein